MRDVMEQSLCVTVDKKDMKGNVVEVNLSRKMS